MDKKEIGSRIRELRKRNGWTQKELAERIGKSSITVRKYENGELQPPLEVIEKLSGIFKITRNVLTGESGSGKLMTLIQEAREELLQLQISEEKLEQKLLQLEEMAIIYDTPEPSEGQKDNLQDASDQPRLDGRFDRG